MPDLAVTLPALVLLPPALFVAAALLVIGRRWGWEARTLIWRELAVAYTAALVAVTFFPFQIVLGRYAAHPTWLAGMNLIPLLTIDARTFLLNVVMTVPLGFLIPVLEPRVTAARVIALGFGVSLAIETAQLVFGTLLDASRTADVNDLIANTLGAALGYLALRAVAPALDRLRLLPAPALHRPRPA